MSAEPVDGDRPKAAPWSHRTTTGPRSTRPNRDAGIFPVIPEAARRATPGILARTVVRPQAGSAST